MTTKKVLIIYPHFPPCNLTGVHRPRLFAQHLPSLGWEPVILTVDEKYYEEEPDLNLVKLLPRGLRIEKVNAFGITKPRLIGDIGLRAFFQLYRRALQLVRQEKFDFVLISIPSFYCALLGRLIYRKTGVRYGIDYIDPWVHNFPGSNRIFSRHWFSKKIANVLEVIAVKSASMITGAAASYYAPVLARNPWLVKQTVNGGMPFGGEKQDHVRMKSFNLPPYLFSKNGKFQMVYAGAMMPKSYEPLEAIFKAITREPSVFEDVEFHFIGTGKIVTDPNSYTIRPLAEKYGLWQKVVFEYPKRIPYLDVLLHLDAADGVFILGSTEAHYTPSKTFQGVLSGRPLLAVLHTKSSAVDIIRDSGAGIVFTFKGRQFLHTLEEQFVAGFSAYKKWAPDFDSEKVDMHSFDEFSARSVTEKLVRLLDQAIIIKPPYWKST